MFRKEGGFRFDLNEVYWNSAGVKAFPHFANPGDAQLRTAALF